MKGCVSIMPKIINSSKSKRNLNSVSLSPHFPGSIQQKKPEIEIITILLVAQNFLFFRRLKALLNFYEANPNWQLKIVGEAKTRQDALNLAVKKQPSLILLDLDFKQDQQEGINTIVELVDFLNQTNQEETKLLVFSRERDEKFIFLAMGSGAVGYVLKENLPSQLYIAIQTVLSGQVYLCPEVTTRFFRGFHLYSQALLTDADQSLLLMTNSYSNHPYRLTQREQEVLNLLVKGYSNQEMAKHLYITIATVKAHLTAIFEKLGVKGRSKAIVKSLELRIV